MTQPLTDQRARNDLIAELYDRHATGLFAYCADQLGDPGTAGYALVAVLSSVPVEPPARAALYALARREIHRRDIVYSPPVVDPLVDPASALVERTLRELRPHQREVLLLCEVCGLSRAELGWVLQVAPDTAEELAISAAHRFRQTLTTALASTNARVPAPVAEVYGALTVAPLRDILSRLPWPAPPASLRMHVAGSSTAAAAPLFVKPLWPVPPQWPQPLDVADPATATAIFPAELLAPPVTNRPHEDTTAPMPRLRGGQLPPGFLAPGARPAPESAPPAFPAPGSTALPPAFEGREGFPPRPAGFLLSAPVPADVLDGPVTDELPVVPPLPSPGDVLVHSTQPGSLFTPRRPVDEPIYRMPEPAARPLAEPYAEPEAGPGPEPVKLKAGPEPVKTEARPVVAAGAPLAFHPAGSPAPKPRPKAKPKARAVQKKKAARKRRNRHHDWAWEVAGFLICIAIAMIVFFSVPLINP
ncbi:hypothetical protein OIE66_03805 [Nonomuraea sp. NBC_01738]|uniref:RNA polymerase sigma factor n=1 Tax=Nonomuraea sp. NBC_01738 TaxID=2976003 RepID=UPI002E122FC6|nr:hypothetical protein OIE66_03805 [Nonomuraea sp. NBC_01738]